MIPLDHEIFQSVYSKSLLSFKNSEIPPPVEKLASLLQEQEQEPSTQSFFVFSSKQAFIEPFTTVFYQAAIAKALDSFSLTSCASFDALSLGSLTESRIHIDIAEMLVRLLDIQAQSLSIHSSNLNMIGCLPEQIESDQHKLTALCHVLQRLALKNVRFPLLLAYSCFFVRFSFVTLIMLFLFLL